MKRLSLTTTIAVFLLSMINGIQVQTNQMKLNQASLDNTEQFSITSKYVEGATNVIQVGLPIDYSSSTNTYPVYYFTDGDVEFGMIKEIANLLMMAKEIKNIIVVGISYGQVYHLLNCF